MIVKKKLIRSVNKKLSNLNKEQKTKTERLKIEFKCYFKIQQV